MFFLGGVMNPVSQLSIISENKGNFQSPAARPLGPQGTVINRIALALLRLMGRPGGAEVLAKGSGKIILVPTGYKKESARDPVPDFVVAQAKFGKEKELREEVQLMTDLRKELPKEDRQHLALDAQDVSKIFDGALYGKTYSVKQERALGDLATISKRNKTISMDDRIKFSAEFCHGLKALHQTNHAYGDLKPENCLMYKNKSGDEGLHLKLSDFGKTKRLEQTLIKYTGNMRYAPPEGILSKSGDVYGAAILMIGLLEESFLSKDHPSLIAVPKAERDAEGGKLTGIEKYLVESKDFAALPSGSLKRIFRGSARTQEQLGNQEKAMHKYIDALHSKLIAEVGPVIADVILSLLKEMTVSDPTKRPIMEDVFGIMKGISQSKSYLEDSSGDIKDLTEDSGATELFEGTSASSASAAASISSEDDDMSSRSVSDLKDSESQSFSSDEIERD